MIKKIHYCWFGGKPLPKSVKKCIDSWKKYLPDYEIIEWNESNFDINQCTFVKEAYEHRKWAFVSDYARIYALYHQGGIYFDTDLKILKDVSHIVDKKMFLGYENAAFCGTAVIGTNEIHNKYIKEVLDFYNQIEHFNIDIIYYYANPRIITKTINKYDSVVNDEGITIFNDGDIYVYPKDYFYPIKFDYSEKLYTQNTCMVHLFNATWTSKKDKRYVKINQRFGPTWGRRINKLADKMSILGEKLHMKLVDVYHFLKLQVSIRLLINRRLNRISQMLDTLNGEYLVISNPDSATDNEIASNLFKDQTLPLRQQYTVKEATKIAELFNQKGFKMIIANSYNDGWEKLFSAIKSINPKMMIKVILNNKSDIVANGADWKIFENIINLYNNKLVDEIGVFSKYNYEYLIKKNFNVKLLKLDIENVEKSTRPNVVDKNLETKIGLYRTTKDSANNIYNQLCACCYTDDIKVDIEPINYEISALAKFLNINLSGSATTLKLNELYKKMKDNDVNLFVKLNEDTSILPIESLEMGVPCVVGSNSFINGTELEQYIKVTNPENINEISEKIRYVLTNQIEIMDAYTKWKEEYLKDVENCKIEFVKI